MKKNHWYYGLGLLIGMIVLAVMQAPSSRTRIVACSVGQGDSILISKGSLQVLIDGGPSGEKVLACLERHLPYWDRTIELIVLTNTDFDHLNGLSSVIDRYQVMQFVTGDGVHESDAWERLRDILIDNEMVVMAVEQGDLIRLGGEKERGGIELAVLWPPRVEEQYIAVWGDELNSEDRKQILGASAKRGDLNERSVVVLLKEGNYRALLTGDSGFQTEEELLMEGLLVKVDYLKVGHHGSKYASSLEFLEAIMPETAVISVGKNNYGHPTVETLGRLGSVGAEIRRTDEVGDVVVEVP